MRTLKKVGKVVLCVIMFISLFFGFTSLMVTRTVSDSSVLGIRTITPEFQDNMYSTVKYSLANKLALVDVVKWDDISDLVTEQDIRRELPGAIVSVTDRVLGGDSEVWVYKNDELKARIDSKVQEYTELYELEYKREDADAVYKLICDTITSEMQVIPQMYIDAASPAIVKIIKVCALWYIPVIVYVLAAAGVMFIGRHHVKRSIYNLVLPTYLAMFAVLSVSHLMYKKDYLANIVIGNKNFQHLLRSIYNAALSDIRQISLVLSVMLFIVGIVISVVLAVRLEKRRYRRSVRRRLRHEASEQNVVSEVSSDTDVGRATLEIVNKIGNVDSDDDSVDEIQDNFADLISDNKKDKTE